MQTVDELTARPGVGHYGSDVIEVREEIIRALPEFTVVDKQMHLLAAVHGSLFKRGLHLVCLACADIEIKAITRNKKLIDIEALDGAQAVQTVERLSGGVKATP
jgi:hypothetical protein